MNDETKLFNGEKIKRTYFYNEGEGAPSEVLFQFDSRSATEVFMCAIDFVNDSSLKILDPEEDDGDLSVRFYLG